MSMTDEQPQGDCFKAAFDRLTAIAVTDLDGRVFTLTSEVQEPFHEGGKGWSTDALGDLVRRVGRVADRMAKGRVLA